MLPVGGFQTDNLTESEESDEDCEKSENPMPTLQSLLEEFESDTDHYDLQNLGVASDHSRQLDS